MCRFSLFDIVYEIDSARNPPTNIQSIHIILQKVIFWKLPGGLCKEIDVFGDLPCGSEVSRLSAAGINVERPRVVAHVAAGVPELVA